MELLDAIETQMICNRLPLVGVTVSAVPCRNTPIVLGLHWHGFIEHALTESVEDRSAATVRYEPVPSSCLQINQRWDDDADLDYAVIEVAWELGAWNLTRLEARPFMRLGGSVSEVHQCEMAFGCPSLLQDGASPTVSEVPDAEDLLEAAGRAGYRYWKFHPVRGGIWEECTEDLTLEAGGYRNPSCPAQSVRMENPQSLRRPRQVVYQFGKSVTLDLPAMLQEPALKPGDAIADPR
jgi:hypothetical protein